jgi:hypothetical protein
MVKSSIELTLKQLIDLGIIKLKKKRRRRKQKRVKQYIPDKSDSSGMVGYSQTSPPNYLNQNTDALRLRDAQADINTRQLEQRLQLEDAKLQLEDVKQNSNEFELKSKQAFLYVLNSINNPLGYAEDDNIGVFGATQGSDGFISQRDTQPSYPAIKMADYPSDIPATDNISVERQDRISSSQSQIPPAQETVKPQSIFKSIKGALLGSGRKQDSLDNYKEVPREDSFSKYGVEDFDTGEPDVIGMNETAPLADPVLVNRQGTPIPQVFIKSAGGGAKTSKTPQQVEIQLGSGDYAHVNKTATKPKKEEVLAFRDWYQDLAGDDVSFDILTSGKRSVLEPAIIKILLAEYKSLGGDNKKLLKSKDSKEVAMELERLKRLNSILAKG